ncbi:hypothetical protein CRYUN_Cryun14cG0159200 [Craigia yunnanensis]
MADHLTRLCQFLAEDKLSSSSSLLDLLQKLRSDESIKLGLQHFYLILQTGLDPIEPGSEPRFKSWSDSQILSLASLGSCITSGFRSLSVEQLEPIIVAVGRKLVEFTVCFLEKSDFGDDDLSLQSNMIQLLEIILGDGTDKVVDSLQPASVNSLVDLLPIVSSNSGGIELDDHMKCGLQVAHAECIRCLILLCKELVELPDIFDERIADTNFRKILSFSLRILKLLRCLIKDVPYVEYCSSLLEAVASCADVLPNLFRPSFEFVNNIAAMEGNFESVVLLLVEEFIHLVQVIFCNSVVFQNVQACIVASILEYLDPSIWRYNRAASNIKPPLAYFPRNVVYILKLIQDLRIQPHEVVDLKELDTEIVDGCADLSNDSPSCHVRLQKKRFTLEERLKMIFSSTLFGNLFSEGSRTLGSADVCNQTLAVSSSSSNCNMPMQAAMELLSFLKGCIFSHEWLPSIYEDGCRMLSADHIDILLSILNCQGCHFEDNFAASYEDRKSGHIHELSFQLLHNLLTHHALSDSLDDYLVEQILNVENGIFVYNDQTLTLLAHALFFKVGLAGSQLRSKIYIGFVSFIVEKAKAICSDCPNLKELLVTLPSVFHIEILLMAFHLSPEGEKVTLANLIFSTPRTIHVLSAGSSGTQLSCWALVVSRLILLLRHMILHPCTCPPSLLLDLRSKLRDTQCFVSHVPRNSFDSFSSFASIAAKNMTGALVEEEPSSSSLIQQLIDVAYLPSPLCRDDMAIGSLGLTWDDLCATFSCILGFWNGEKAAAVEDLIVERYIFLLCWDIPAMKSPLDHQLSLWSNLQTLDISSIEHFILFSHSLLGQCNVISKRVNFQNLVVGLLRHLHAAHVQDNIENLGWDFLRNGMWMSLVLSLFNVGIGRYCLKNKIPVVGPFWTQNRPSDTEYINSAEGFISYLIADGQTSELLRMFSSFLNKYLLAYEKAFLATLGDSQHDDNIFSSVLLLKQSTFDKFLWGELLKKCGVNSFQLEFVLDILLKLDGAVEKRASSILAKVFWECILHGFPSHLRTSSGILLSCILNVRGITFTLDGLLKLHNLEGNIFLETDVLSQILDSLMSVKLDHIFESLHGKCEDVYLSLNALELSDYTELFLLKRMEGFLRDIHSRELSDTCILEWVITNTIDTMDALRKGPSKSTIFKFYLGAEDMAKQLKEMHGSQRGDILVLIDSVANCYTESVNIKVLNFFVDILSGELCPNLKLKIQSKFLSMDLLLLSKWLEKRLLGCTAEALEWVKSDKANFVSLRESTMGFILCLVSSHSELQSELYNHLFEAVLVSLETAFMQFDIHTAKLYFHFVVQLARGESSMKLLLKRTIILMQKLAEKCSGKSPSISSLAVDPVASRLVGSRKNSDTLVLSANRDGESASLECDATSVDEDEDDGTSDGEVASIDKDEEEDTNSERALASKVCTFTSSGSNFMEQHWYFCYTCDLTISKGCCSVCAKVCHRGHRVVYSRSSRFFCDCGAGGVRGSSCQCLKPQKFTSIDSALNSGANNFQSFLPFIEDADQLPESDSDVDEDVGADMENSLGLSIPKELQDGISMLLEELDVESQVLELFSTLLPSITSRRGSNLSKDKKIILGKDKVLSYGVDLLQLKKAYKSSEVVDGLMQVSWGILDFELPDTQTMNNIVISAVELIYSYAECLALHGKETGGRFVAPAVVLFKKLLFFPNEAVQTSSSLAISSRLLQVPFPKQTMLGTDDVVERAVTASVPADTSGGNTQVMIEEDFITSSVQYCCDGCSTVPILRQRWHCTVCPDFDLCEACYEVLDADRLPPPHSRDHPMTAIPIEVESLGGDGSEIRFSTDDLSDSNLVTSGDGSEIRFSTDDLSDSNLVTSVTDVSMQTSAPSIHVLEPSESMEFSASMTDSVSISASKRAVNSLLLSELLEQLKGWMETTSGVQAIPVMQLFYRLSSAVGGPFIDSSKSETLDLEKLIKWFLDEINLNKPFVARTRSSFGEVAILVFMFFTLMLRNWHQPGSDIPASKATGNTDTPDKSVTQVSCSVASKSSLVDHDKDDFASQLLRACNSLRNQAFVNYLMDILQQLVHVFKSPAAGLESSHDSNVASGCGALLTVQRDLAAGNFSPFFSDSYAKAHRADTFMDYHQLLLENAFRLVYTLVRPEKQDKSGEKEKAYNTSSGKDMKLDGYQEVLCSYINNPHTAFVRRYARRLFLHLCGSKTHYYSVRDSWQFSTEVKKLYKHVNKYGGFQNPVPYERSVKIVKCLSTMAEVAAARPQNWQKYCLRHGDVLPFLMNGIFYFGEESVIQTLKLLNLAFYLGKDMNHSLLKAESGDSGASSNKSGTQSLDSKKKKGDDGIESGLEKSFVDMEVVVEIFTEKGVDVLRQFIDCFLLEWNSSSVRAEAKCVLYGVWHHGKHSFKETLLAALLQKVKCLPMYGQNIVEYTELVTWLLGKFPDNSSKQQTELVEHYLTPDVVKSIFETLHSQNELVANHPNSCIYNTLSGLVEFDGYYLESEPCVACSSPEVPYSRMKLESLKSETKFTDNRIIVKCTGSYRIQTVTMNVHDARKSKSVKVLNLYYSNRPVADLSELKNNWSLWKRAKSCHLAFNQNELKVEFPIPITACNFMIELDSFYENFQALSLEPLQCPRCSRPVTDKHGICSNCHENAHQCRQCRNINYENLDSFLCNECGYSKYGRFEFNFMAKPSFTFDKMENDEDMKRGLAAIEAESENAHRRYQQLLGFKKPLLKIVSSIGENVMDSQQKDSVQQMMVSLPGPSCKINRKIALLGVLYGEKCKAAFDFVSKSVQTLQGLRSCLEILQVLSKHLNSKKQLVAAGFLSELFENNIHQGPKTARVQARAALCAFSEGDINAVAELNSLIQKKVMYCLEHHHSMDIAVASHEELLLLSEVCSLADEFWESRLRVVFHLLFSSIKLGAKHPAILEHIILPCLTIISLACTPPKPDTAEKEQGFGKSTPVTQLKDGNNSTIFGSHGGGVNSNKLMPEPLEKNWDASHKTQDIQLLSYSEWGKGASYLDFVRRRYKVCQAVKGVGQRSRPHGTDFLALKYGLRWKRSACKATKGDFLVFELGSWVTELVLSACSQSIRSEMCMLISLLCAQSSSRQFWLLNLLMGLLLETLAAGESAAEYFELLFKMIDSEDALLFLTVRGCLDTICKLITQEVGNVESLERSLHINISQGFILHKLIELLGKFLEVPNIRSRFVQDNLLSEVLEALIVIHGLIVQKTKLISDCNRLLKDLLDSLLLESSENKRQFISACICGLQIHGEEKKGRTCLEEFIRGSMTKNPYSSAEIGLLMRDVKNKICHQLDLIGLLEDDYGMELLVAGNIISLDLSIAQVYEQVWKKSNSRSSSAIANSSLLSSGAVISSRDCPPMIVTYRLQCEATEPMIKELEEDREESQDPEVEFAIAGAVREYDGLEILLRMIQRLRDDFRSNQEQLVAVLNLLMHCCKTRENRRALLRLGALGLLLETARRAFSVDAMEPAEGILLIVESLTMEANESDNISISQSVFTVSSEEAGTGEQAKKIILMFLERLCHPSGLKKSNKQHRNTEMVARILPYLSYGEPAAMEALIQHFNPYLQDWGEFDQLQKQQQDNPKDESIAQQAAKQRFTVENFVRVSESLKTSSCGERLKDIILEKGITGVAVRHLSESFAVAEQAGFKSSAEWASALKLPSVPHVLSMLRGLSMGHFATQRCIDEGGILPLLHALEGVSGENEIGAKAENLLDTLSNKEGKGDGFLEEKVCRLRHATRDEMRRRALRKREELLQGLGMRQELASDGGYSLRPNDLLGVYSYSKRVNLGVGTSGSARGERVYTTVSYFNIIHFQCHQEAKRADAALKNTKKEWEGATLRNNESLCNSLFPVRGLSVPLAQYVRYVDQYWDNLNALGHADGSRLRLLTYDIVLMLARFATGASFSAESRGGGRESNSRFLPFMIQMAHYLLEQGGPSHRCNMAKAVATYIASSTLDSKSITGGTQPSLGTEETVQLMMVNSLLSESYESWLQHRRDFLEHGIYHAYMQHTHGRSTSKIESASSSKSPTSESGDDVLLSIVQPMLVYTGLIEQLQQIFKVKKSSGLASNKAEGTSTGSEGEGLEGWEVVMKERLLNVKVMIGFSKELLSWLDDMTYASDLQEAFDIIGVLGDVLSGGFSLCEDFVQAAIAAGKM